MSKDDPTQTVTSEHSDTLTEASEGMVKTTTEQKKKLRWMVAVDGSDAANRAFFEVLLLVKKRREDVELFVIFVLTTRFFEPLHASSAHSDISVGDTTLTSTAPQQESTTHDKTGDNSQPAAADHNSSGGGLLSVVQETLWHQKDREDQAWKLLGRYTTQLEHEDVSAQSAWLESFVRSVFVFLLLLLFLMKKRCL